MNRIVNSSSNDQLQWGRRIDETDGNQRLIKWLVTDDVIKIIDNLGSAERTNKRRNSHRLIKITLRTALIFEETNTEME